MCRLIRVFIPLGTRADFIKERSARMGIELEAKLQRLLGLQAAQGGFTQGGLGGVGFILELTQARNNFPAGKSHACHLHLDGYRRILKRGLVDSKFFDGQVAHHLVAADRHRINRRAQPGQCGGLLVGGDAVGEQEHAGERLPIETARQPVECAVHCR